LIMSPPFRAAAAALGFALALVVTATSAQPPEVEDTKPKTKKKVVVDDPDSPPPKATAPGASGDPSVRLDELAAAAAAATNPAVKAALERYTVPFDKLTTSGGVVHRVKPIPLHRSDKLPAQFGIRELSPAGVPGEPKSLTKAEVKRIEHFEDLALAEAEAWLKKSGPDGMTPPEFLGVSEKLLAAALRFHDYAKANNQRTGKAWDDVRRPLDEKLKDVRVRELRAAAAAGEWARVREATARLLTAYPNDPVVAREAAEARVGEAERLLKTKQFTDQVKARELLDDFEARFPGAGGEPAKRARRELRDEAQQFFLKAQADKSAGNDLRARDYARQADALDPNLPGLRELSRQLGTGSTVLSVGARIFPERLSPVTARFDSEKQVVELLFESLLQEVPDPAGGTRYRPGAALGMPLVIPGGRELAVRTFPARGEPDPGFDAHDVAETVKLYRTRPELWTSAALPWLEDLPTPTGPAGIRFSFRHGHPDPRALLTFKLLPARWLTDRGKRVDDADFSARPIGTGPFKYNSVSADPKTGARTLILTDNPNFGRSRDRTGLPVFHEVRFVELGKGVDSFEEFRHGRLHVMPDLTPAELARALSRNGAELGGQGQVYTAATNRRVHVLALNHRRPPFQSRDLRRGLGLAIDREGILQEISAAVPAAFRRTTAPMTGPYPAGSWAAAKGPGGLPAPLLDRNEAIVRISRYLGNPSAPRELKLTFQQDDPTAVAACERIKAQVESLFKDAPEGNRLKIELDPRPPREFLRHVESEQRYDMAYVPFDYPDDWHPFGLAAYLDPDAATRDGRNVCGYLSGGTNPDADDRILGGELAAFREHRDYAGDLAPRAARVHTMFNDRMPFVPLWQLDRHTLVSGKLKVFTDDTADPVPPYLLNPTGLFQNAARWKLE
ncbi:MAG TPA: ABC transporter substrate-binding protein, partial [Urbifossiella sp.]|nr:ABC transporter substrate-binding protein [Urbifossiella sp.]